MARYAPSRLLLVAVVLIVLVSVSAAAIFLDDIISATGLATGIARVRVVCMMSISLPASSVDFGDVYQGQTDDTSDGSPAPMVVQNDGSVRVDVTIARDASSSPLFSGTGGGDDTASFQFKADSTNETGSFNHSGSITNWTNVPGTAPLTAIYGLKYSDSQDSAEIDLRIQVPTDEPMGEKNETLDFTATASEGAECGDEGGGSCKDMFWECADECHDHDSDCHLSCGHQYSECIREECITTLQSCKDSCTSSECRRECNEAFKECARG
jgi:hypothetical protein